MRLTPKREERIRKTSWDAYSGEVCCNVIDELLSEIDHLRANSVYMQKLSYAEQVKANAKEIETVRALNMAKMALKAASKFLAPSNEFYMVRNSCEKVLKLIEDLEK
jgi:hypothetical protein